jgi:catechol 2,3-dioxygenase-like lactoylglutathione lyase family enzyme
MPAIPITRIAHCNVNCSSIERSLRFYEDVVGLKAISHMHPELQRGGGFPMPAGTGDEIQFDAYALADGRGPGWGPVLDLLEWKVPAPVGAPYPAANHLGFYRLCYLVPSVAEVYDRFVAAGAHVFTPPMTVALDADGTRKVDVFFARDPDGTCLEFVESGSASGTEVVHVNVNCSDLARSRAWYTANLGFEVTGSTAPGPQPGAPFGFDRDCEWDAVFLSVPCQQGNFIIDLLEWKQPAPAGPPYPMANHLGIYRMAFMVDDIHACYETLRDNGVSCSGPPVKLDMGPDVAVKGLWALFFSDPDGTCLELIETPQRP